MSFLQDKAKSFFLFSQNISQFFLGWPSQNNDKSAKHEQHAAGLSKDTEAYTEGGVNNNNSSTVSNKPDSKDFEASTEGRANNNNSSTVEKKSQSTSGEDCARSRAGDWTRRQTEEVACSLNSHRNNNDEEAIGSEDASTCEDSAPTCEVSTSCKDTRTYEDSAPSCEVSTCCSQNNPSSQQSN